MKKGRRTVEKDTAKPRVKFSPDIPELPLNNLSDLEDDDSSLDLTYDDFAYGGSKSSRAARNRPPAVGRDPGNYGPLSAREMGMSRMQRQMVATLRCIWLPPKGFLNVSLCLLSMVLQSLRKTKMERLRRIKLSP